MLSLAAWMQDDEAAPARRNVLFIAVDDLRPELGCYGAEYAETPSLDALAAEGSLFTHHYASSPSCGPSRYALLTGRSPRSSGVTRANEALYRGRSALDPSWEGAPQSLPERFRRSGYHTTLIGKVSHTPDGHVFAYDGSGDGRPELPGAWDVLATPFGPWERGWGAFFAYAGGRHREDGSGHAPLMEFRAETDEELPDGLMAARAITALREASERDEPFFLGLGFYKPHLPFVATRSDWEALAQRDVPPPSQPARPDSRYWHRSAEFTRYATALEGGADLSAGDAATVRRAYLACVRFVDRQIGKVLAELEKLELDQETIVVVWGDHGWHLGESAMWGKHSPHERALRSVLLIRAPGTQAGLRSGALVEATDLYPTLLELAGLESTETRWPLDGQSLAPILRGEASDVREQARSYWGDTVSIRSANYRLIARLSDSQGDLGRELYAAEEAPDPVHELSEELPDVLDQLSKSLAD